MTATRNPPAMRRVPVVERRAEPCDPPVPDAVEIAPLSADPIARGDSHFKLGRRYFKIHQFDDAVTEFELAGEEAAAWLAAARWEAKLENKRIRREAHGLDDEIREKLRTTRITVQFDAAEFNAIVDYVREVSEINFVIEHTNIEDPMPLAAFDIVDLQCDLLLDALCAATGRSWRVDGGVVVFERPGRCRPAPADLETSRIDLCAENATLDEMLDELKSAGVAVERRASLPDRVATVDLRGVLVRPAVDWLRAEYGVEIEIAGGKVIVK